MAKRSAKAAKPVTKLDVNDMLRMATTDDKFARALVSKPEDFKSMFNLKDAEVKALRELPRLPGGRGPGGRIPGGEAAFEYDA